MKRWKKRRKEKKKQMNVTELMVKQRRVRISCKRLT